MKLQTVDGALRTLELLAEHGGIRVRDVASALDCSRSSAYRIIRTLQDRGWIAQAEQGAYELGPFAFVLGTRAIQRLSLREVALPSMRRLVELSEETVTLSVLVGEQRMCVEQLESERQVRMSVQVGRPYPLHAGASGRAILMGMDPEALDRYLASARLDRLTPNTPVTTEMLLGRVEEGRRLGYIVAVAERDRDAYSIAAPFRGRSGMVGSIAICGPVTRYNPSDAARFGPLVHKAAHRISVALGTIAEDGEAPRRSRRTRRKEHVVAQAAG